MAHALASTALAAAAMLAKEMAVTEPALVVLVGDRLERGRSRRAWILAAAHGAVGARLRRAAHARRRRHRAGSDHGARRSPSGLRDAPWLLAHYLWISVAPLGHAAAYRVPPPGALALAVTLVAIGLSLALAWRTRRVAAVGLAWFALALVPVLHLVPLWADLADRFALFPSVGLALARRRRA